MREDGGMKFIEAAIEKLGEHHSTLIKIYGKGNEERLTGKHETCSIDEFRWGVADRGASVRIPYEAASKGKGWLEDRRPSSNIDYYVGAASIASVTLLDDQVHYEELQSHYHKWAESN